MARVLAEAEKGNREQLAQWFRGNIVLIGTTDLSDKKATPFYLEGGEDPLTAGVEIHASTLATLLEGRFLREIAPGAGFALVLLMAVLAAGLTFRFRFPLAPLLLAGIFGIYFAASVRALGAGMILPVVAPALAVVLGGFSSYGVYALTEGRKRRLLEDMFGRYVSPEVAQEILGREEIPLGGARQPVTVMFCDLRNYTSYCQGRDPHQVVAELNEYFTDMTAEIKAHGGMVNKFIGDGIMALFGAPVPHPEDPLQAVACALRMIERNDAFNRRRAEQGLAPLVLGVGIHTGEAVVGTIGTREKMEYTAIGDTVNVASRIEGENKTFETQLLVSEATYRLIRDCAEGEQAGIAHLKGVSQPMPVFRVAKVRGTKQT
jgi:adenylate cyclase